MAFAKGTVVVRSFAFADQTAARRLILQGMAQHFGFVDETLNPDVDDVSGNYIECGQTFLVAELNGGLVGTGALLTEDSGAKVGRIVRMSVAQESRRVGIGRSILSGLLQAARDRGFKRIVLETNDDWEDAIGFYQHCGFREYERGAGLIHMVLELI